MIRVALILVFSLVLSLSVHASNLRFGSVLINEGKPVTLLLQHMGQPLYKSREQVCLEGTSSHCRRWGSIEKWLYRHNDLNYSIYISSGVIRKIEWSRF